MLIERLVGIVWANDFSKMTGGRERGQEDPQSHYRKGVSGDWRTHFTAKYVDYFKEMHNPLLLKLGYEGDPDWS